MILTGRVHLGGRLAKLGTPFRHKAKGNVHASIARSSGIGVVAAVCRYRRACTWVHRSAIVFRGTSGSTALEALAVREPMALAEDINFTVYPCCIRLLGAD